MKCGATFAIGGDDPEVVEHGVELVDADAVRLELGDAPNGNVEI